MESQTFGFFSSGFNHTNFEDRSPGRSFTGSAQKNYGPTHLKRLRITLPPLDLQHRFAAIVESIERQKASQRAHLAELDTLFASLQSRAFRGDL